MSRLKISRFGLDWFFFGLSMGSIIFGLSAQAIVPPVPTVPKTAQQPTADTSTSTNILTNQQQLATNQSSIIDNQNQLALNQSNINSNIQEWLASAITDNEMESLLLDSDLTEKGATNLVDQLKEVLTSAQEIQSSAYQEQAVNLFQTAVQSNTMQQSKANLMSDFVSLILSGAGNPNASESLWVSDVLPDVSDPSDVTVSTYNSMIFPYTQLNSSSTGFQVSTCDQAAASKAGMSTSACNLMKSALYTQALSSSCSSSYASSSSSSSQASSSASTAGQAASASSGGSSGPQYDKTVYPSGFNGGCSAAYYQTEYNSWNGWNQTLAAILNMQTLCQSFISDNSSNTSSSDVAPVYQGMTTNIISACTDFSNVVDNYAPKQGQDNSSIAQNLMADLITPLQDLIKYDRRLIVKQIFDQSMKNAVTQNPDMAFYGSLYTLIGTDSYINNPAPLTKTTDSNNVTTVSVDMTPALSQDCVQLIQDGGATVSVSYQDTDQSKLANLLVMQLASMYPMRTVLPIVSFEKPESASSVVAINGQIVALDSAGKVMTLNGGSTSSVPQIEQDVNQISSAQSSVNSAMITANQLFQGVMDSYLKGKASAVSPLMDAYSDRYLQIKITGSDGKTSCSLTPAQLNRYAATWRLNSQVVYADASASSTQSSNEESGSTDASSALVASWAAHLATSTAAEVSKEIASLEAQSNYMKYIAYHQNERLGLIGTLVPLQQTSAMASSLKTQSAMIDKLVNDYVTGVQSSAAASSTSSSASS